MKTQEYTRPLCTQRLHAGEPAYYLGYHPDTGVPVVIKRDVIHIGPNGFIVNAHVPGQSLKAHKDEPGPYLIQAQNACKWFPSSGACLSAQQRNLATQLAGLDEQRASLAEAQQQIFQLMSLC